ncbi:MAG: hypothetical protein APU95_01545 [Hadesarchaea archaeon YNP_N21]|jgi:endonuclease-3|nr:MAG: hypothetical protein APU95_01545 [Hadesarchaea archaeon YNP_N21]
MENAERMASILDRLRSEFGPWSGGREDPFSVLVWTVLSQNTNDRNTKMAFDRLVKKYKNFGQLARADLTKIQALIRPAGLHRAKSSHLKETSKIIETKYGGSLKTVLEKPVHLARAELLSLPGVGYKTADCLLLFSAKRDVLPVDTHIFRVSKRLGFATPEDDHEQVKNKLENVIPRGRRGEAHIFLIALGRKFCRAKKPLCNVCPINALCPRLGVYTIDVAKATPSGSGH